MATTSQNLTWIELECHGWQRTGARGSLALFNQAHRILNTGEFEQNLEFDETTGDLPYITTVDSQYKYTFSDDIWRTSMIVVDHTSKLPSQDSNGYRKWNTEEVFVGGNTYYRIKNIRSQDKRQNSDASIIFSGLNPGSTTSTFRRVSYLYPVEITSDRVQHQCPGDTDIRFLNPATMRLINTIDDHQKLADTYQWIEAELKPRYALELDKGEQGIEGYCEAREY